jgi:segregation and condensation protein B
MDDIARDPLVDAQVVPNDPASSPTRIRMKGPIAEFGVEESDLEEALAEPGVRLPRVLPLAPADDGDVDDLLRVPRVQAAAADAPEHEGGDPGDDLRGAGDAGDDDIQPHDGEARSADAQPEHGAGADLPEDEPPPSAEPITDPQKLVRVVFGLLLTNREGLSTLRLAQVCETTQDAVRASLDALRSDLVATKAPLELTQSGETWKLWTTPEVFPYLETLRGIKKNERLSPAALETLAVIAYRQPVFRAEIEAIRGVKVGPMLRTLLDCKLVKIVGRADVPGRPLQYGTTQYFLERFGLSALSDLPSVKEFKGLGG